MARLFEALWPGHPASLEAKAGLSQWIELLAAWNTKIDLTAARSTDQALDLCLADALVLHRARAELMLSGNWLDVGTGAGAPGLAMAILDPALEILLVEPNAKRVAFLRQVIGRLRLGHVTVKCARAEALDDGCADDAVARATWSPAEWAAHGRRLTRQRVWLLLARDPWTPEPGDVIDYDRSYVWPLTGVERRIVAVRRT